MKVRDEIGLAIGVVLALQVFTLAGAVGLLSRVSPIIENTMEENEASMAAVEEMLGVLAEPHSVTSSFRFEAALARAKANVTESAEPEALARVDQYYPAAISGDPAATAHAVAALRDLSSVNRTAMKAAGESAAGAGRAGAWTAVFLGLASMLGSVAMVRRLHRRVVVPLQDLDATLAAARGGDPHRRCRADGAEEFRHMAARLNELIDALATRASSDWQALAATDRGLLLGVLDRLPQPTWIVDGNGTILASNESGARASLEHPGIRGTMAELRAGKAIVGWDRSDVGHGSHLIRYAGV